ncbi:histidinol-phosphatase [Enterococcus casseliflavus]|uniref:PHP domain-containing protein n=1 Tax=Enterococcus casseliflavus TaxID=37734 RepID=UPI001C44DCA0|nr:PHP domain-containing protein [Enterococcus casseliflavus]MBV6375457.1 histidinol-phosphatase [Enterococcus casseliflavus]
MKKIDLHIHTKKTISDSKEFDFSLEKLKEYVKTRKIDAIAITNHNVFDEEQFNLIKKELDIVVFPGVEIDLEKGHILLISDNSSSSISDLSLKCEKIKPLIKEQSSSLTIEEFYSIFSPDKLKKYLLIPHYMKSPVISDSVIKKLNEHTSIHSGEVQSARKFVELKNNEKDLTPVFFSDSRISTELENFSIQQTYLNISEISLSSIKLALSDNSKVSLSKKEGKNLFELTDGIVVSTGLNVLVGERSSGKTHLLNDIYKSTTNTKYIKQFELVEHNDEESKTNFNNQLMRDESIFVDEYLYEFNEISKKLLEIDPKIIMKDLNSYTTSLIKNAENTEKKDSFARAKLFSEELFKLKNLENLNELIKSTQLLLENKEYAHLIEETIDRKLLKELVCNLITEYRKAFLSLELKRKTNEIIEDVRGELQLKTRVQRIKDIDFEQIALAQLQIQEFDKLVNNLKKEQVLDEKEVYDFTIRKLKRPYKGAQEILSVIKRKTSFTECYKKYDKPFEYLLSLKKKDNLSPAEFFRYFVKIQVEILNKDMKPVSGGQRAEYNFLRKIEDSLKYDMLLIDEPESSFDNMFLNTKINNVLRDISLNIPVFVSTHNNTIGASIKPDCIIHTKRNLIEEVLSFDIYTGSPGDKELFSQQGEKVSNLSVQLDCLEAGEETYILRRENYEILDN